MSAGVSHYPAAAANGTHPPSAAYPPGSMPPGGAPVPDSYFTESRKGEINELRNLLRGFATERDPQRKRDIIKKVIAYMTLGIDVSRLFSEMMLAIETRDLVIKKMVYLYLTNYARTHPELAQMCTNTLQKDCGNEDPMVRGLALRSLCGLNLPQMVEYICDPLRRGLSDGHPYVRKTAVMGLLKFYHLDRAAFEEDGGFCDLLYDMLRDPDASVVANCIIVLNEVMQTSPVGGMAINRAIMLHLLNRIQEFDEFSKVQVLELVPRYIPANDDEGFQIMNLLDPVLRTASSGAVMATISAFLSLAEHLDHGGGGGNSIKLQIVNRIKAPVVTHISSGSSEQIYALLKHVQVLVDMAPGVFDDEYRQFYIRYHEPTHVKYLKVSILSSLANHDTAPDIVAELAEVVSDNTNASASSKKLSRLAIRSMAKIAAGDRGGPGAAEAIARRLVDMLDWNQVDHVSSEAATALTLMIRKHGDQLKTLIAPPLVRSLRYITEPAGKTSIIYLLGECGDMIPEAPYAVEKLIDSYGDIKDPTVKIALITTTMKLFFLRPPEVQHMLGRLLDKACDDVSSQDLHDRALLYYRMLRSGSENPAAAASSVAMLERVVKTHTAISASVNFAEEDDAELRAELLKEFNTLSVLFGKTAVNFIAPEFQVFYKKMPEEHPLENGHPPVVGGDVGGAASDAVVGDAGAVPAMDQHAAPGPAAPAAPAAAAQEEVADLLGFGGPPAPAPAPAAPSSGGSGGLQLMPGCTMAGDEYQSQWGAVSDADAIVSAIPLRSVPSATDAVESALAGMHVATMASGVLPNEIKFFLYAKDVSSGALFLIQSNIDKTQASDPMMIVTVKVCGGNNDTSRNNALVQTLVERMTSVLN